MITNIVIPWMSAALGLWVASKTLRGVQLGSAGDALWAGALLALLNWLLHWLVFVVLGIATLGIGFLLFFITTWVASAIIIQLTAALSSRLRVEGFVNAVITALFVAGAGVVVRWLFRHS
jgi:uncharacterized membrane protein YvlD (DUF360 family)